MLHSKKNNGRKRLTELHRAAPTISESSSILPRAMRRMPSILGLPGQVVEIWDLSWFTYVLEVCTLRSSSFWPSPLDSMAVGLSKDRITEFEEVSSSPWLISAMDTEGVASSGLEWDSDPSSEPVLEDILVTC